MCVQVNLRCTVCGYGICQYHLPKDQCNIPKYNPPEQKTKPPGKTVTGRRKRYKKQFTFD